MKKMPNSLGSLWNPLLNRLLQRSRSMLQSVAVPRHPSRACPSRDRQGGVMLSHPSRPHPSRDSNGADMSCHPSRAHPSPDREGGVQKAVTSDQWRVMSGEASQPAAMPLTPEQFQTMFAAMLADPESRGLLLKSLVGAVIPIQGGVCKLF